MNRSCGSCCRLVFFWAVCTLLLQPSSVCQAAFTPLTTATPLGPWEWRESAAVWTSGTSVYFAGGYNNNGARNDVYASADAGITWESLPSIDYLYASSGVAFNRVNYVFGGRPNSCADSPVYFSMAVGYNGGWTTSAAPWGPRARAMAVVWNPSPSSGAPSQIIFIGGTACNIGNYNDVWSYNGVSWSALGNGPFSQTVAAGITTIQNGSKIIMAGGEGSSAVWMGAWSGASHGLAWYLVTANAPWSARPVTMTSTVDDVIFLINGNRAVSGSALQNDVWSSADGGQTWAQVTTADNFSARQGAGLVAIFHQLVLFAGKDSSGRLNDVWQNWDY